MLQQWVCDNDISRGIGGRSGTGQVRWRGANMIDNSGAGTAGSDTYAAPGSGCSTWTRLDNL